MGSPAGDLVDGNGLLGTHQERRLGLLIRTQRRRSQIDDAVGDRRVTEQARGFQPRIGFGLVRHDHQERPVEISGQQPENPRRGRGR